MTEVKKASRTADSIRLNAFRIANDQLIDG